MVVPLDNPVITVAKGFINIKIIKKLTPPNYTSSKMENQRHCIHIANALNGSRLLKNFKAEKTKDTEF